MDRELFLFLHFSIQCDLMARSFSSFSKDLEWAFIVCSKVQVSNVFYVSQFWQLWETESSSYGNSSWSQITTGKNSRFYFNRADFPLLFCIYRWLNFAHSPCWLARFPGLVDIVARCSDYTDSVFFLSTSSHTESARICLCCIIISLLHYSDFFSFWRWWGKKWELNSHWAQMTHTKFTQICTGRSISTSITRTFVSPWYTNIGRINRSESR